MNMSKNFEGYLQPLPVVLNLKAETESLTQVFSIVLVKLNRHFALNHSRD